MMDEPAGRCPDRSSGSQRYDTILAEALSPSSPYKHKGIYDALRELTVFQ